MNNSNIHGTPSLNKASFYISACTFSSQPSPEEGSRERYELNTNRTTTKGPRNTLPLDGSEPQMRKFLPVGSVLGPLLTCRRIYVSAPSSSCPYLRRAPAPCQVPLSGGIRMPRGT